MTTRSQVRTPQSARAVISAKPGSASEGTTHGLLCQICSACYTRSGARCVACIGDGGGTTLVWAWLSGLSIALLTAGVVFCFFTSPTRRKATLREKGADKSALKRLFDKPDADQSGAIDKEELNELCQELIRKKLMDEELEEAMKMMDTDQNGTVEFEEFYGWLHIHGGQALSKFRTLQDKGADKSALKRLFDTTDADQSGAIDNEEPNELCQELI